VRSPWENSKGEKKMSNLITLDTIKPSQSRNLIIIYLIPRRVDFFDLIKET
jgi:hypothetical protein